ncbi:sigma-54-dependent transcriptional regulator [Pleionea litopenaei]|uniref:Sigma-54 dependent transcriptional regulator n=1 Tax=Pleionea litopenaei TaxID=3070815 RepID=A0AA51RQ58_9GAMM|nr:sigma-54 dependent transcriptional regulator [Pleionea sp. HL-JVS1]WMS85530.1 sigma-54 dependent transcriptional regulator [Pleionea sp. HL-JVS1]
MANRLLLIEQSSSKDDSLKTFFTQKNWQVTTADSIKQAASLLIEDSFNPHVIIADIGSPKTSLLDDLSELQEHAEHSEWIFLHQPTSDDHQEFLTDLAFDLLEKPFDLNRLNTIAKRALRTSLLTKVADSYSLKEKQRYQPESFFGSSSKADELRELLVQLKDVPISALTITGETGTGKGLVAKIIHYSGLRKDGPLIELNCAALPKDLLESQLFGHEAGAFTGATKRLKGLFEQADGGTLFLDEIGDMDIELQSKLLKAIEDQKIRRLGGEKEIDIDVQFITATSVDIEEAIQQGNFREDLYHRISVFTLKLPSLNERKDDLIELVPRIIAEFNQKANKSVSEITDASWEKLLSYQWPGNVRELRNVLERCVLLSNNHQLPDQWLQLSDNVEPLSNQVLDDNQLVIPIDGTLALEQVEKLMLEKALEIEEGNVTAAAKRLQISRETMRYRMKKFELSNG